MPVYVPRQAALSARLHSPHAGLVLCFCAAWCDTCRGYQPLFAELAEEHPAQVFVWVDIEEHPELLGETEVENFPTLFISCAQTGAPGGQRAGVQSAVRPQFFGPLLPHISHLRRLLARLPADGSAAANTVANTAGLPDDWLAQLLGAPAQAA